MAGQAKKKTKKANNLKTEVAGVAHPTSEESEGHVDRPIVGGAGSEVAGGAHPTSENHVDRPIVHEGVVEELEVYATLFQGVPESVVDSSAVMGQVDDRGHPTGEDHVDRSIVGVAGSEDGFGQGSVVKEELEVYATFFQEAPESVMNSSAEKVRVDDRYNANSVGLDNNGDGLAHHAMTEVEEVANLATAEVDKGDIDNKLDSATAKDHVDDAIVEEVAHPAVPVSNGESDVGSTIFVDMMLDPAKAEDHVDDDIVEEVANLATAEVDEGDIANNVMMLDPATAKDHVMTEVEEVANLATAKDHVMTKVDEVANLATAEDHDEKMDDSIIGEKNSFTVFASFDGDLTIVGTADILKAKKSDASGIGDVINMAELKDAAHSADILKAKKYGAPVIVDVTKDELKDAAHSANIRRAKKYGLHINGMTDLAQFGKLSNSQLISLYYCFNGCENMTFLNEYISHNLRSKGDLFLALRRGYFTDACKIAINYLTIGYFYKVLPIKLDNIYYFLNQMVEKKYFQVIINTEHQDVFKTVLVIKNYDGKKLNANQLFYYQHVLGDDRDITELLIEKKGFFSALMHGYFYIAMVIAWNFLFSYKTEGSDQGLRGSGELRGSGDSQQTNLGNRNEPGLEFDHTPNL